MERATIEIDLEVNRAIEAARSSFGQTPNDILRHLLGIASHEQAIPSPRRRERATGLYHYSVRGSINTEASLKDAYVACLKDLIEYDSQLLGKLTDVSLRSRRIVSRNPKSLYTKSPHLADYYAFDFGSGWWIDLNLSEQQVRQRLKIACELVNLPFGKPDGVIFSAP
jgi:hypothetical protein